jgi:predicted nucleic acid-binding protein
VAPLRVDPCVFGDIAAVEELVNIRSLEYVPVSWEASRLAGHLKQEWTGKGKTLSLADLRIAAVCLTEALTLITDNRKEFAMAGLTLHPLP